MPGLRSHSHLRKHVSAAVLGSAFSEQSEHSVYCLPLVVLEGQNFQGQG